MPAALLLPSLFLDNRILTISRLYCRRKCAKREESRPWRWQEQDIISCLQVCWDVWRCHGGKYFVPMVSPAVKMTRKPNKDAEAATHGSEHSIHTTMHRSWSAIQSQESGALIMWSYVWQSVSCEMDFPFHRSLVLDLCINTHLQLIIQGMSQEFLEFTYMASLAY